jgi:1,2-diacylglycerol 3-alpha-glucosyltransferase
MRVAHLCLSNWYVPGFAYQENELVKQHVRQGHDVLIIASTEVMTKNGKLEYLPAARHRQTDGVEVIRLPYRFWPFKLARKLRAHKHVYDLLQTFKPDSILFHGAAGYEIITVARYAHDNPQVLFYVDSHEDKYNSALNFFSREVLHKIYYRYCLSKALPQIRKLLCYSTESIEFVKDNYGVPANRAELFPLGGNIPDDADYFQMRNRRRSACGFTDQNIVFIQSGKLTRSKKILETLTAFRSLSNADARLIIAGSLDGEIERTVMKQIVDMPNVKFFGWQSPESLQELLCASDVYVQPGTQSVTMQNSMCCRCAQIIADVPAHRAYFNKNGWLVRNQEELYGAFMAASSQDISDMKLRSYQTALEMLDYKKLANRVLKP